MKSSISVPSLICAAIILSWSGCTLLSEDNDDFCKNQQLENSVKEKVRLFYSFKSKTKEINENYSLFNALEVQFIGLVRNIDCNTIESEYKNLDYYVYPSKDIPDQYQEWDLYVSHPMEFIFNNYHDYISVSYNMRAVFPDGSIYKCDKLYQNSNIYLDMDDDDDFIIHLYQTGVWHKEK